MDLTLWLPRVTAAMEETFGERLLFFSRIGWPEIGARVLPMRERLIDTGHDLRQYEAVKSAVVPAAEVPEASVYAKLFFLAALRLIKLELFTP